MAKITWDKTGDRFYETGVDHGVLYVMNGSTYGEGVPWNGLTAINESPSGGEPNAMYADNIKYLNLMSAEEFGAAIEAYTFPDEFKECDGYRDLGTGVSVSQQSRKQFGLCYRTRVGNDTEGSKLGYKIHLIYNALASPSEKNYETVNDDPSAIEFSWDITTTPVEVTGLDPAAHIIIDSRTTDSAKLKQIEDALYGTDATTDPVHEATPPTLLLPSDIIRILNGQ